MGDAPHDAIRFWSGETLEIGPGLTLIRSGGHFEGSTLLHRRRGADGAGTCTSAINLQVRQDRRSVSFMRSYPITFRSTRRAAARRSAR